MSTSFFHEDAVPPGVGQIKAPPVGGGGRRTSHEIDYQIYGEDLQFAEVILDPGETVIAGVVCPPGAHK